MDNNLNLKVGRLSIALYPTHLQKKDGKITYHAKVVNRATVSMADICNDLVASGNNCGLSSDELETVWHNICQARKKRLAEGISSRDDLGTLYPSVKGTFADDQSPYIKGVHTITVRLRASEEMSETMANLTPAITQGNTCHPVIDSVQDIRTQTDTALTPGGLLNIKGRNICLVGDDEAVGLYFENVHDMTEIVKVSPSDMSTNSKNVLCLIIPTTLKGGCSYRLRLVTQYSGSKQIFRKEPLIAFAATEFVVPTAKTA
ncbi:MAG: DUF4469 domain-containing protein [Treponemataceae bacterium]|nr:DUF4469 domain-containing protein [Treponemataceae bacterium]